MIIYTLGSVVNPRPPAGVSSRNLTSMILSDVIIDALGQAAPDRVVAPSGPYQGIILAGTTADGQRYFVDYENFAGGQGARRDGDGMDAVQVHMSNTANLPIEVMEIEFPVRVERYELVADSGGSGRFRGGCGVCRDLRILGHDVVLSVRSVRQKFAAQGGEEGEAGQKGAYILNPGSSAEEKLMSTFSARPMKQGDLLRILTPGGGGLGVAASRDPSAILRDRAEGKVGAT